MQHIIVTRTESLPTRILETVQNRWRLVCTDVSRRGNPSLKAVGRAHSGVGASRHGSSATVSSRAFAIANSRARQAIPVDMLKAPQVMIRYVGAEVRFAGINDSSFVGRL
jgi:hypothetical protein